MTPATILRDAAAEGVRLILTSAGKIKAAGNRTAVARWLPVIRENKPGIVAALQEAANDAQNNRNGTAGDLDEIDSLLRELSQLEGWTEAELSARLEERRRMAPVNVYGALQALRVARDAALAGWPEKPAERALIVLCRLVS